MTPTLFLSEELHKLPISRRIIYTLICIE